MSDETKPLGGTVLTKPFMVLAALTGLAVLFALYRFVFGIGAVSNMSDGYPWGIWIAYDVVVGTAIACGGYAMAILIYILNKGEYHPLIRSALLGSVFGYTLAGVSIMVDIGRYWQAYNLFLPWHININSIMFEVAACVTAYILVLWIEFGPAILEGWRSSINPVLDKYRRFVPSFVEKFDPEAWNARLKKVMFVFIAIGVLLPTMHQSSLGTLMVIAGQKLSPLWQTGFLPLLFLISAISMGYSIVVFESILSAVAFKRSQETPVLSKLSAIIPWLLTAYLVIRFGDLLWRGALGLAVQGDLKGFMFIAESILFVLPAVLLFVPSNRSKPRMLFISATSVLLAGAVYRFNAFLIGYDPGAHWSYFPAFPELMITVGVIAFEIMMYLLFVKKFSVLPKVEHA